MNQSLQIEQIPDSGNEEIREFVLRNPNSLIYFSPEFLELISGHLDARCSWLVVRDETILAGLPYLVKEGPFGKVFNSLAYYGSNGGILQTQKDGAIKAALIDEFYNQAQLAGACSATIISNPLEQDSDFYESHTKYDYRDERIGQITHFPPSGSRDELLALFQEPRPRNIRRALKEGVVISERQDEQALRFLFNVHAENMQSIGGLSKEWSFFESIPGTMPEDSWKVYVATLEGTPIAALLLFYFNKTVEYFTPVVDSNHRKSQALPLAIYEAMGDAMESGYLNWNWGGTWLSQSGVYDFKKRWGTMDYPYFYYTRLYEKTILEESPESLMKDYAGFYLLPFSSLIEEGAK